GLRKGSGADQRVTGTHHLAAMIAGIGITRQRLDEVVEDGRMLHQNFTSAVARVRIVTSVVGKPQSHTGSGGIECCFTLPASGVLAYSSALVVPRSGALRQISTAL